MHKIYVNGRLVEVDDLRKIPGIRLVDMQTGKIFVNKFDDKIGSTPAGATVTAKSGIVQMRCMDLFWDQLACGADGLRNVYTQSGQPIGKTTGRTGSYNNLGISEMIEITVDNGVVPSSDDTILVNGKTWVFTSEVNILAGTQAEGAGFPITYGSKNNYVYQLQTQLQKCGFVASNIRLTGEWRDITQAAVQKAGIKTKINSLADFNQEIQKINNCTNTGTNTGTGTTGGTNTGTGTNTGGAIVIPQQDPAPAPQDNTLLYVGGAALLFMMMNKKKRKR